MSTKSAARIRKILVCAFFLGIVVSLLGVGGLPAAHAQDGTVVTPVPTSDIEEVIPGDFEKDGPVDGKSAAALSGVTLSWEESDDATIYYYCFDTVDDDRCNGVWYWSDDTDYTINKTGSDLGAGVTYYWQVMACTKGEQPSGCIEADDGEWWSFKINPLVVYSTGSKDGWVRESSENSEIGGSLDYKSNNLILGDDASDRQYITILSFDTTKLPNDAVIKKAVLQIKQNGSVTGTNPFSILGNLYVDVKKGYFGSSSSLQKTDFQAGATAYQVGTFNSTPSSGWYNTVLNSAGRGKINKAGLTQFRLYFDTDDNDNLTADYMRFYSGNSSSGKPSLTLSYTIP